VGPADQTVRLAPAGPEAPSGYSVLVAGDSRIPAPAPPDRRLTHGSQPTRRRSAGAFGLPSRRGHRANRTGTGIVILPQRKTPGSSQARPRYPGRAFKRRGCCCWEIVPAPPSRDLRAIRGGHMSPEWVAGPDPTRPSTRWDRSLVCGSERPGLQGPRFVGGVRPKGRMRIRGLCARRPEDRGQAAQPRPPSAGAGGTRPRAVRATAPLTTCARSSPGLRRARGRGSAPPPPAGWSAWRSFFAQLNSASQPGDARRGPLGATPIWRRRLLLYPQPSKIPAEARQGFLDGTPDLPRLNQSTSKGSPGYRF